MRCFATDDGQMLVEWAPSDTDVLTPDGTPLQRAWTFHLLDSAGTVVRTWMTTSSSVQEHLTTIAYVIEGDALICYSQDVAWRHEDRPSLSRTVELDRLRSLSPAEAPSETAVRAAIGRDQAARRAAWAEHERVERDRLAQFERALPVVTPEERITLIWRYSGRDIVIARSTGEEVWREADWPWMGKDLYRRLRRVAEQKYGGQLAGFEVDVPADEYLRFDND